MEISKYLVLTFLVSIIAFFVLRSRGDTILESFGGEGIDNSVCDELYPDRKAGRLRNNTCYYEYENAKSCKDVGKDSWKKCKTSHGDRNSGNIDSGRYIRKDNGDKQFCEWETDSNASTDSDGSCKTDFTESETDEEPEELPYGCVNPKYREYILDVNALDSSNTHRHHDSKCGAGLYRAMCDDSRALPDKQAPSDYPNKNSAACVPSDYEVRCKDPNANPAGDPNWPGYADDNLCSYDFIQKPVLIIRQDNYYVELFVPKSGLNTYNEKNGTKYSENNDGISTIFNDISAKTYNIVFGGNTFSIESTKMPIYQQGVWSNEYIDPLIIDNTSPYLVLVLEQLKSVSNKSEFGISGDFYTYDFVLNEMEEIPICFINSNTKFDMNKNVSNEDKPITYRIENVNDQLKCVQQQWIKNTESDSNGCSEAQMKTGISTSADAAVSKKESSKYIHDFSGNLATYKMEQSKCKETRYIPFGPPLYHDDLNKCPANYTDCSGKYVAEPPAPVVKKIECINTPPDDTNSRWLQMLAQNAV